jgi:hypothetical protein
MVGGEPWGRLGQDQEHIGKEGYGSGAAAVPRWRGFSAPRPCAETEPVYLRRHRPSTPLAPFMASGHARSFDPGLLSNANCGRHAACRQPCGGVYSAPLTR